MTAMIFPRKLLRPTDGVLTSASLLGDELTAFRLTPGRLLYLLKTKFQSGPRVAYYRDFVRPWILHTAPFEHTDDPNCEIHVLTSADDWLNLLWTLKTFYYWSRRRFALCIHDDGTLNEKACAHLRAAFPAARLIRRAEADARVGPLLAAHPRSLAFRTANKLALKVFDFHAYLEAKRLLLLDSDILFFAAPAVLLARIADSSVQLNSLNKDWRDGYTVEVETVQPLLPFTFPPLINSGLGLIHRASIRLDLIEEFLALPRIMGHSHKIEQTLIALCSAKFGFQMLPEEYDVHLGPRRPTAPSRHYSGPVRHLMYGEGIRDLVQGGFLQALRQPSFAA